MTETPPLSNPNDNDDIRRQIPAHHKTPTRAKVLGAIEYIEKRGLRQNKSDVFRAFDVPLRTGWRIVREGSRTLHNSPTRVETRGRKPKITPEQLRALDHFLRTHGIEGRRLRWLELAEQVGITGVSARTIAITLGHSYDYASYMLRKYPRAEDWRRVRFSDEVHFSLGPEGRVRVLRQPGERYCGDCIQEVNEPRDSQRNRIHYWAAVGYNFKSNIYFYTTKNKNGKMTQVDYITQLEKAVKPWLERGDDFVLEEDGDSSHGPTNNGNIVQKWKKEHNLKYYFNCAQSPDLLPIENCWQPVKSHTRTFAHWDDETLTELVIEGWAGILQESIDV
ncbi:hypothetical protein V501_01617 [Pseudogymnoascus sp. VKM F-4519 (FW-2642)]|nr:hypothetical protein V501_01617 [Pseudogymnoascus sp. VKM F-4519 (FW-2642)]